MPKETLKILPVLFMFLSIFFPSITLKGAAAAVVVANTYQMRSIF